MGKDENLDRLHEALVAGWAVPEGTPPSMGQLLEALSGRVHELLDRDVNRLTTAMYTLDIDEGRFDKAMGLADIEMKSAAVAELILEREIQKMESRIHYEKMKRREQDDESTDIPLPEGRPTIEQD